ncbi:MAG: hypothetical protein K2P76_03175 [Lachnospiraceae bacterium]|nr:hypothetical protein [Lachnospiraceae bacterium]
MDRKKYCLIVVMILALGLLSGCQRNGASTEKDIVLKNDASGTAESEQPVEQAPNQEFSSQSIERVVCWGDSLTFGQGGEGVTFPSVLGELLPGVPVINYGIQGETAKQIAIRAGSLPMTVSGFVIPADATPVQMYLWQNGEDPIMLRMGDAGINPCTIGGVQGILTYNPDEIKYYFTRTIPGEAVAVNDNTQVITYGDQDKRSSDVVVLFAGTNRAPDKHTVQELVDTERQILDHIGSDRYVVIGLTSKELVKDVVEINEALAQAFGEHFLDIRSYYLENGLKDGGITPTDQDVVDISQGEIPTSLRVDVVHGNSTFYRLLGKQVYEKFRELGYISP